MDQQIIERAVEAAAKAEWNAAAVAVGDGLMWGDVAEGIRNDCRAEVRLIVTAALAEVETSLAAERDELRRWKDEVLPVLTGLQELGRELGVPIGHCITGEEALERAKELRAAAALAEAERDDLAARVARVEALHRVACRECCPGYQPCPTIKALRGES